MKILNAKSMLVGSLIMLSPMSYAWNPSGDPSFDLVNELNVLEQMGCNLSEYKDRDVLDNLLFNELSETSLYATERLIPEMGVKGLVVTLHPFNKSLLSLEVAAAPVLPPIKVSALLLQEIISNGTKRPLLSAAVVKASATDPCQLTGTVQTWTYGQDGKVIQRAYYSSKLSLIKKFDFYRPVEPLENIFPDFGICTDDLVYPSLSSALAAAHSPKLVKIAIVDSGVDYNHPYLAALISRDPKKLASTQNFGLPDDETSQDSPLGQGPQFFSHGTAVAYAATQMDARFEIIPVKVTSGLGHDRPIYLGIQEAVDKGAQVINLSLNIGNAIEAIKMIDVMTNNPSVLFITSAGNENENLDSIFANRYPAMIDLPNVLTVASVDNQGKLSSFSNYGPRHVELAYYGEQIPLPLNQSGDFPMTGTSFSSPLVAHVAALMKVANPKLSPEQIIQGLEETSDPLTEGGDKLHYGIVNPDQAVAWAELSK